MDRETVLRRLRQRIDYILDQARLNQRPVEYLWHKAEILEYLQEAVGKVHSGTYGFCKGCGRFIGVERLKVIPGAVRCVECQNTHEKEEARRK